MKEFWGKIVGTVVRPGQAFATLAEDESVGAGGAAMLVAALVYSIFSVWLFLAGHQPTFTGNPIPAEHYYLWQAAFLPPWLSLAWAVSASAVHGLARVSGSSASWRETAAPWGFALAVPLVSSYVVPEMVVFGVSGHDALVSAMRVTGPITLAWWAFLGWKGIRAGHGLGWFASAAATAAGLLVFGGVTAFLVR